MSIFFRETKAHRKGLFFWCVGMIALIASGMAKYAAYQEAGQSINDLLAQFPKTLQIIFGMYGIDLSTATGFFAVLYLYIALMGTVHAVLLGSDLISKEERDKTSEFLFVRPVSRPRVIGEKLLAGVFNLIIFNLVTTASSIYFVSYFAKGESVLQDILVLMAGLFFLQLIFFSIGAAIAGINQRPKSSASIAAAVLLLTFILSFLVNLNDALDTFKYLTPFKYFEGRTLLHGGRLDPLYVGLSLVLIVLLVAGTYRFYSDRDLRVSG